ncbi:hypothetical protein [Vibrio coralliilyticus]|uniref:hypothetical protein n=1 Tax=Vibrio coralliilyticus TaxID=190893 RepID=UPI00115F25A2|nr:hypothetical protein [Vibrio coralliilyticus]
MGDFIFVLTSINLISPIDYMRDNAVKNIRPAIKIWCRSCSVLDYDYSTGRIVSSGFIEKSSRTEKLELIKRAMIAFGSINNK